MRINILIALFAITFSTQAQINAGDPDDNTFHVFEGGFALGANMSQVHGDLFAGFNKLGLNVGPILHINFTENWYVDFEVLFTQKGSRTTPNQGNTIGYTYQLHFNYVEIPLMIGYNDKNRLLFQAGLAYARLFSVLEEVNGSDFTDPENFENMELSYVVGGTILIGEQKHFGLDVRYQHSITSVGVPLDPNLLGMAHAMLSLRGVYFF